MKKEEKKICTTIDVADILAEYIKSKGMYGDVGEYIIDFGLENYLYFAWEERKVEAEVVRGDGYEDHLCIGPKDGPRGDLLNPNVAKIKEILLNYMGVYEEDVEEIKID